MDFYTKSAGGVVARKNGDHVEIVLLRDLAYTDWTLPKGHVEEGESLEDACLREVYEEAGLTGVIIQKKLGTVERRVRDTNEIKTIMYFLMTLQEPMIDFLETDDNKNFEIKWWHIDTLPDLYLDEQKEIIEKNRDSIKNQCI